MKIIHRTETLTNIGISIGIASQQIPNQDIDDCKMNNTDCNYYMFCGNNIMSIEDAIPEKYGRDWNDGDEISINLDLKQGNIRLSINGDDQGVAYDNIKQSKSIKYRLFVSLYSVKDCVELLNFSRVC